MSLEIQAEVRAPRTDLLRFLSGWPPYDNKTGLLAFSQLSSPQGSYRATLFLSGADKAESHHLLLELRPGDVDKSDLDFDKLAEIWNFFNQRKRGFSVRKAFGVVHEMIKLSAKKKGGGLRLGKIGLPRKFTEDLWLTGMRAKVRKRPGKALRFLCNDVILETVGEGIHIRLATREIPVSRDKGLTDMARAILACQKELPRLLGKQQ